MKALLIDNYDSFTYNLVQYIEEWGAEVDVYRNDKITLDEIKSLNPDKIVISPGPCTPNEAGISVELVKEFADSIPILGVCLGHQAIAVAFGGKIIRAPEIMHGRTSEIYHDGKGVYQGVSDPFTATRYHSLIVEKESCPADLEIVSHTDDGIIMGLRHKAYAIEGVQFHPESILTSAGKQLMANFLNAK